ncbi:hypothetical protein [Paenibacillus daejeonensis]|uniref:hypothetical protein n=1 Tax=Paenibacillus daejeonensis TaxID=135193 RepID=UPI000378D9E3|nr:hypothetical protein [Paenibacillus daejeonensis]
MREDQFRKNYKKAVDNMKTNDKMKQRMEQTLNVQKQEQKRPRRTLYIAASVVIAASIGLAAPSVWQQVSGPSSSAIEVAQVNPGASFDPVVIPKMELPDMSSSAGMSMIGLVVYEDNIYTQSATSIDAADAAELRGEKLGTTTGGIDEWSGPGEYTELASTIGAADIYAVKGYDSEFRIMSYTEIDGQVFAQLFDQTNDITVSSGADLIGKLNLQGNVASAEWETFASWNNGLMELQPLAADGTLDSFISALYAAKPVATSPELEEHVYGSEDRKIIYLTLEDNTQVQLVLFGEGLVRYGDAPVFFEVEEGAF